MAPTSATQSQRWSDFSLMYPIVGSHIQRIGWLRTIAGGLPMYLAIPFLVTFYVTGMVVAYDWILRPILGLPRVRWVDYVIIDRHRIEGLSAFDKFNCMFCGYANGLCTMANTQLDHLAARRESMGLWQRGLGAMGALLYLPFGLIFEFAGMQIVYNVLVSRPLGMHRVSVREARQVMDAADYGAGWGRFGRAMLRMHKNTFLRFSLALEQIESSWCPLRHLETRAGVVYPKHHAKFFGPTEIEAMRETLSTRGTVSDRLPTW